MTSGSWAAPRYISREKHGSLVLESGTPTEFPALKDLIIILKVIVTVALFFDCIFLGAALSAWLVVLASGNQDRWLADCLIAGGIYTLVIKTVMVAITGIAAIRLHLSLLATALFSAIIVANG